VGRVENAAILHTTSLLGVSGAKGSEISALFARDRCALGGEVGDHPRILDAASRKSPIHVFQLAFFLRSQSPVPLSPTSVPSIDFCTSRELLWESSAPPIPPHAFQYQYLFPTRRVNESLAPAVRSPT
jgi:hypothetical protein